MHLYNLTLQPASNVTGAVVGQFSGTRQQEVVVARGGRLELLQVEPQEGRLSRVLQQPVFGNVRSLACFRLTGGSKDYLVLGSDSGRIVILEYVPKQNTFVKVHQETFGRSGNRRIVPGQYLATDPKGRAVLIGAVEKSKLIYILNRDTAANLTISSPLEANRAAAITHSVVGVDVGYENPLFAALEVDYSEADTDPTGAAAANATKVLTYYELDLGLNHVVRRWSDVVDRRAHHLVQVPGAYNHTAERWDGPSGVLVCTEDYIVYRHQGQPEHRVPIPRRYNPVELAEERRGSMIVASVLHRMKGAFFFLVQNEEGDLFRVTVDHDEEDIAALRIKYFATVPVAASLCILRSGYLYVASEFGTQHLYAFQKLGDDDELPEYVSTAYENNGAPPAAAPPVPTFTPCALENILPMDELAALDPILDARVCNALGADAPQFYLACGRGARSTFRQLQHGLEVHEAVSSDLPGVPNGVWATRLRRSDAYDGYIVLSFVNGTLVLSIGETIEEVADSGFATDVPTLCVQQLGTDAILQVHARGIRHIQPGSQVNEWAAPAAPDGEQAWIVASTTNERQVVVALSTHELVYFELDMEGQLNEYQERRDMGAPVTALSVGEVPQGRQRTPYLAVGCADNTVRIVSLDPESTLATISMQALTAPPSSICINEMLDVTVDREHLTMFVNIGLQNGVHLRTVLDPANGQLTGTRTRFLGSRPVRLVRARVHGQSMMLALSSRTWLAYTHHAQLHFTPLIFDALEHVWGFSAELCPDGLIGVVGDTLRILTVPHLGAELKQDTLPLTYTPRRMAAHPADPSLFVLAEADHRVLAPGAAQARLAALPTAPADRGVLDLDPHEFGPVSAGATHWASCLRVVHGPRAQMVFSCELEEDEAALSLAFVPFASADNELFLVVGTAVGASVAPRRCRAAYLHTYRLHKGGQELELLHKTEVDDVPLALHSFHGRLLAGVGSALRIYELGRKKLLRKCENRQLPNTVVSLQVQGTRIVAGDMQESVQFLAYKPQANRLVLFADDTLPRWTTCTVMLDYDTVMAGDKFGNVFVLRLDESTSRMADKDPTGLMLLHEKPYLNSAANKLQLLTHYHVGDILTSLSKVPLVPGGRDVVVYTGLAGTVGALVPFVSREDVNLMTTLEMHLRQETSSLVGRDHLAYRGAYVPVKGTVDGDLCETYGALPHAKQAAIAEELDRTPAELHKKLAQLRETTTGM